MPFSVTSWQSLTPVLAIASTVLAILVLKAFAADGPKGAPAETPTSGRFGLLVALIASGGLFIAAVSAYLALLGGFEAVFDATRVVYRMDGLTAVGTLVLSIAALLSVWLSSTYLIVLSIDQAEYYALLLLSLCGMLICLGAESAPLLFVGLELMSLPLYALAAFDPRRQTSQEAGIKLLVTGACASATLLYGLALVYGATGHTDLAGIQASLDLPSGLASMGFGLIVAGLLAKVALVPFHSWAPDVLEGAPSPLAGMLSIAPATTALLVLVRWLGPEAASRSLPVETTFTIFAIASIVLGSVMALIQENIKRMLAYLCIAQAGIFALAFVAASPAAYGALLFYLLVQVFVGLGAFAVVVSFASARHAYERIDDLSGLARRHPALAAAMTLFLLAFAGFPGTAGFWARFQLFGAAIDAGAIACVIVASVCSVIILACALRVVVAMYMHDAPDTKPVTPASNELAVLIVCAAAVLYLGLRPDIVLPGHVAGLIETLVEAVPTQLAPLR